MDLPSPAPQPETLIARAIANYEHRPQQLAMIEAVSAAFHQPHHLLVEAGTGVGKSFAYLLPAIETILKQGRRVLVSTYTIALQEQLIHKDIPALASAFNDKFKAVLVKGRQNYLGLRRLTQTSRRQQAVFSNAKELRQLHVIEDWAYQDQGRIAVGPRLPARRLGLVARPQRKQQLHGRALPVLSEMLLPAGPPRNRGRGSAGGQSRLVLL